MSASVVGLLDYPNSRHMGVVPVVVQTSEGRLFLSGAGRGAPRRIFQSELRELVHTWAAREVSYPLSPAHVQAFSDRTLGALWVGRDFARAAKEALAPPLPCSEGAVLLLIESCHLEGSWEAGPTADLRDMLRVWVEEAARLAFERSDHTLARLAVRTLPKSIVAQAVAWATTAPKLREEELRYALRYRNAGDPGPKTVEELEGVFSDRIQKLKEGK